MEEMSGCWREAQRTEIVSAKLLHIQNSTDLEIYEQVTVLLRETDNTAMVLRDLHDLFPIYRSRVHIVLYYLTIILPSLCKTLMDMMIYIDDDTLSPLNQWNAMCERLNRQDGTGLAPRFVMYLDFLVQCVRLLSRSPLYNPTALELGRMRVLRLRLLQGIPAPQVPITPAFPPTQDITATAPQTSTSHSPPLPVTGVENPTENHWAEWIFSSIPHSVTGLRHRRASRCFGPHMSEIVLGFPTGSKILFKMRFDKGRLSVICFETSPQDSSQTWILCRWMDGSDNPQYSTFGVHQLHIQRRGSSLQFRRWSTNMQHPTLWMALFFKTFEKMILFHCTFLALKARSPLTIALPPDQCEINGEIRLFRGRIVDDGFEHLLSVYQDDKTNVIRLHAEVYQGELKRCPIWTAFVSHQSESPRWLHRRSKHRVWLHDINPSVFCASYNPEHQRQKSGEFELWFANISAADAFEKLFYESFELPTNSEEFVEINNDSTSKVTVERQPSRQETKDNERTGERRAENAVEEDDIKVDVMEWQKNIKTPSSTQHFATSTILYENSISVFVSLYRILQSNSDPSESQVIQALREEFRKFYVWNDALGTQTGQLDQVLKTSRNLNKAVLSLLAQWARVFCKLPRIRPDCYWVPVLSRLSELESLIARVDEVVASLSRDEPFNREVNIALVRARESSADSDSASLESIGSIHDVVEDLKVCTECLSDLIPSLECPARDKPTTDRKSHNIMEDMLSVSLIARPFVQAIKDKYPGVTFALAIRIGEAIWRRRIRLRSSTSTTIDTSLDPKHRVAPSIIAESSLAPSSRGRYSRTTKSSFVASSIFDETSDPDPEPDPPQREGIRRRRAADSVTSVRTSIATDAPKSGQRRVPKLPAEGKSGTPFRCQICRELLRDIFNRGQWKKHVFDDLEPYICTFGDCGENTTTFKSRREWSTHESNAHADRSRQRIDAGKCPICTISIRQPEKFLAQHISRHLREFSLASLPPLEADEDEEQERNVVSGVPEDEYGAHSEAQSGVSSSGSVDS